MKPQVTRVPDLSNKANNGLYYVGVFLFILTAIYSAVFMGRLEKLVVQLPEEIYLPGLGVLLTSLVAIFIFARMLRPFNQRLWSHRHEGKTALALNLSAICLFAGVVLSEQHYAFPFKNSLSYMLAVVLFATASLTLHSIHNGGSSFLVRLNTMFAWLTFVPLLASLWIGNSVFGVSLICLNVLTGLSYGAMLFKRKTYSQWLTIQRELENREQVKLDWEYNNPKVELFVENPENFALAAAIVFGSQQLYFKLLNSIPVIIGNDDDWRQCVKSLRNLGQTVDILSLAAILMATHNFEAEDDEAQEDVICEDDKDRFKLFQASSYRKARFILGVSSYDEDDFKGGEAED